MDRFLLFPILQNGQQVLDFCIMEYLQVKFSVKMKEAYTKNIKFYILV